MGIECLKMFLIYQKIFKVTVVSFIQAFAVSPEIVPAPESHRGVALLISSQSRITFGRSFSCQDAREKNIPQGVRVKNGKKSSKFENFFIFVKIAQQKSRHIDSTNSGRTFHPLAQFALKLCNGLKL